MSVGTIRVEEEALSNLKSALAEYGESYKSDLARLQSLVEEITSGDIQGDPATDLLNKFRQKEETFRRIAETIDEAEEFTGVKATKFSDMIGSLKSGMR